MAIDATGAVSAWSCAASVHPEYRQVAGDVPGATSAPNWSRVGTPDGTTRPRTSARAASIDETACVVVQHPNFFGCLEEVEAMAEIAHRAGALLIVRFRSDQPGPA